MLFVLRQAHEFPITFTTQIPLVNSSPKCFFSCSTLLKPARSSLPSQKHMHFIKCLHHITNSHNLIFLFALWKYLHLHNLPQIPTLFSLTSLSLPSHLFINSSSQTSSSLFSLPLEPPRRIVPE